MPTVNGIKIRTYTFQIASRQCLRCKPRRHPTSFLSINGPSSRTRTPFCALQSIRTLNVGTVPKLADTSNPIARHEPPNLSSFSSLKSSIESLLWTKQDLSESEVLGAFRACSGYARQKRRNVDGSNSSSSNSSGSGTTNSSAANTATPTSAILSSLYDSSSNTSTFSSRRNDVDASPPPQFSSIPTPKSDLTDEETTSLSLLAYEILAHPSVFITPSVLSAYVNLQIQLNRLTTLPSAFTLYSQKPYCPPNSSTPKLPNQKHPKFAIPDAIANLALHAAIHSKNMPLCLNIISTTYSTPAYRNSKILRKATPLIAAAILSPIAVYVLAGRLAHFAPDVDPALATNLAFAGFLTYLGFTGAIGLIAIATRNDQMVRITWVPGTPLRHRWLQEEERAAYDLVAQAWGFQEVNQRGLEEGPEWELLKATVATKGMIVDNPALLEGME